MDFSFSQIFISLVVALFVGGAAGLLGAYMVMKRMALVGDALTHVALPGMGLALVWGIDPFGGAFVSLFFTILAIWWLREYTNLPYEALVGIFFATALALGVLIIPDHELVEALFGDIASLSIQDAVFAAIFALVVMAGLQKIRAALLTSTISEDIARASGISVSRTNLLYLLLVALIVAVGAKFVGALLMGSLVIIPAAAAQNVARSFGQYTTLSAIFGIAGAVVGVLLSFFIGVSPGPLVVLCTVTIFGMSFFFRK